MAAYLKFNQLLVNSSRTPNYWPSTVRFRGDPYRQPSTFDTPSHILAQRGRGSTPPSRPNQEASRVGTTESNTKGHSRSVKFRPKQPNRSQSSLNRSEANRSQAIEVTLKIDTQTNERLSTDPQPNETQPISSIHVKELMTDRNIDFTPKALDKQSLDSLKGLRKQIKDEIKRIDRKDRRRVNRNARKKRNRLHNAISQSKGETDDIHVHKLKKRIEYYNRKSKKFFLLSLQKAKESNQSKTETGRHLGTRVTHPPVVNNDSQDLLTRAQLFLYKAKRTKVVLNRHLAGDFNIRPINIPRVSKIELAKKFFN